MDRIDRKRFGTGEVAHDFALANPFIDPGQIAVVDGLGADLDRARELDAQQRSGRLDVRTSTVRRQELRREVQVQVRQVVAIGTAAAAELPELATRFGMPRGSSHQAFLTNARGIAAEVQVHRALFEKFGMAPALLEDLNKTLDEYEKTIELRNAGRRKHVGARSDLQAVMDSIMTRITQLDAMFTYRYRNQPEQLGAWKNARDIPWPKDTPVAVTVDGENNGGGE